MCVPLHNKLHLECQLARSHVNKKLRKRHLGGRFLYLAVLPLIIKMTLKNAHLNGLAIRNLFEKKTKTISTRRPDILPLHHHA